MEKMLIDNEIFSCEYIVKSIHNSLRDEIHARKCNNKIFKHAKYLINYFNSKNLSKEDILKTIYVCEKIININMVEELNKMKSEGKKAIE